MLVVLELRGSAGRPSLFSIASRRAPVASQAGRSCDWLILEVPSDCTVDRALEPAGGAPT